MATSSSCFSLVSFYEGYLRNAFTSSGLSSQTIEIDSETTIHFWSSPNLPSNSKPPLILIHGFGANPLWQWCQQVQSLSSQFSLYVPDLVFFGKSTTKSSERSEIFQAVSIGKLLEKLGVKWYSVMGTSYGGFVAYHMARMWPKRVEKVIIASSAVNMRRRENEELIEKAKVERIEDLMLPSKAAQLRVSMSLAVFKRPFFLPDFVLNDIIHTLLSENREEKIQLLKGLTLGKDDTLQISPLQQEVLIVWGEHDKIFPLEKAFELKELLGDKVSMEVIKKTAHAPQQENPKQFNSIVRKFLSAGSSSS
ncbi:Alpha/beta hydrolase fold-1 [Macleaya cordata]|uniref:Alpha/beta hydrolase fold-1 n=1 Tax=Macleaya cordata TaxID=56857 RepID=A0A200QCZ5_MACCD|nr:Alpha/beta hydrolase fold-1 [Macleaya cordata]